VKLVRCNNCSTKIQPHERRLGYERGDASQPGYEFSGCVLCAPDANDEERARNAHDEAEFERARTADMEVW
jgi:hypothetical protein